MMVVLSCVSLIGLMVVVLWGLAIVTAAVTRNNSLYLHVPCAHCVPECPVHPRGSALLQHALPSICLIFLFPFCCHWLSPTVQAQHELQWCQQLKFTSAYWTFNHPHSRPSIFYTWPTFKRRALAFVSWSMSCGGIWGKIEPDISNKSQSVEWCIENINSLAEEVFIVLCLVSVC